MNTLSTGQVKSLLCAAAELILERKDLLTEIDGRFGDGDHGITMEKIAGSILKGCRKGDQETVSALCEDLGMDMCCLNGGSASSLWGTMFQGFAEAGIGAEMDAAGVKALFAGGLRGLREVSNAQVGDKTMMDALIPAVECAGSAGEEIGLVLRAAAAAAAEGMEKTKGFVSRYGRAKSYGAQTIGTPDAGAASTAIFFEGLLRGYEKLTQ